MTDSLLRRGQYTLAPAQRRDLDEALAMCLADEVANVVPLMHVEEGLRLGSVPSGLWVVRRRARGSSEIAGVVWAGANLTAVLPSGHDDDAEEIRAQAAAGLVSRVARPAAIVGQADVALDLWGRVEPWWRPAREVRPRQVSMAISHDPQPRPLAWGTEPLRLSTMEDYPRLLPAAVHMFMGEVGYDPMRHGRAAYEDRLQHLVRTGRSFVQMGHVDGRRDIVFKAEVGIVGGSVAQVQGVWVHPSLRGQGLAKAGMAALVPMVRARLAPTVSLYVNDFNDAAVAAYTAIGFREVGMFATVMF
jgi:predicted GNAT family acetyltransferase